jgi:hypothetical protein
MANELMVVTTVNNELEATVVCGRLADAGIQSMQRPSAHQGGTWNPAGARDVCVAEPDLDRALEVLQADEGVSEEELTREEELTEHSGEPGEPEGTDADGRL